MTCELTTETVFGLRVTHVLTSLQVYIPLVFYMLYRRWTTHRPMSEFLGAIGEFDEPDPTVRPCDVVITMCFSSGVSCFLSSVLSLLKGAYTRANL